MILDYGSEIKVSKLMHTLLEAPYCLIVAHAVDVCAVVNSKCLATSTGNAALTIAQMRRKLLETVLSRVKLHKYVNGLQGASRILLLQT